MKMTHSAAAFEHKWPLILLVIAACLKLSASAKNSSNPCLKFKDFNKYTEVCGTDGNTYSNRRYLYCLNKHLGKDIGIAHLGCCSSGDNINQRDDSFYIYSPVCGPDGRTWSNIQSLRCHNRNHKISNEKHYNGTCIDDGIENPCVKNGFEHEGLSPVCANNGFTYQNLAQVKCLRKYNPDLRVLYDGKCSIQRVINITHNQFSSLNASDEDRIQYICEISKTKFEWNPICGTDNITYSNPFAFLCMRANNTKLKAAFHGVCDSKAHIECIRAGKNYNERIGNETVKTVKSTLADRVCGYNGITYKNIHELHCLANRDKDLTLKHRGACLGPKDNPCGAVPCDGSRFPICASNNVTYVSIEAMWCINRQNNSTLYLRHEGPCLDST